MPREGLSRDDDKLRFKSVLAKQKKGKGGIGCVYRLQSVDIYALVLFQTHPQTITFALTPVGFEHSGSPSLLSSLNAYYPSFSFQQIQFKLDKKKNKNVYFISSRFQFGWHLNYNQQLDRSKGEAYVRQEFTASLIILHVMLMITFNVQRISIIYKILKKKKYQNLQPFLFNFGKSASGDASIPLQTRATGYLE
ncbi:hypothetical protein EGR_02851 [Echinococcus granulosus]|uniref:Uncharacterized protein n=1 Tax=Echinococcus granulosus TaxID=6210 RepID=W6UMV4_ECHGR|nr:hypothetical protein EGR_02851 [Echinococcus granulosus]EUB62398.1 hypothetical protein EGR_02851 [Echinococcus granulosus]